MIPSASPRQRSRERGEITWVTLLLLLSLVTLGYLAVVWGPIYLIRYEAGMIAIEYANKAVHDRDDAALVQQLSDRLARLEQVKAPAADGSIALVTAVEVRPQDITWERNTSVSPPTLHVAFEYTTSVHYPLLDRFSEKTFVVDRFQEIAPAKW
jgi:hypothetical protein